jgi:hypothetical protein
MREKEREKEFTTILVFFVFVTIPEKLAKEEENK